MADNGRKRRERTADGNYAEEYPREKIVGVLDDGEPRTSREVADAVGCTRPTAAGKLIGAHEDGLINGKRIAGRIWIFWESDDE